MSEKFQPPSWATAPACRAWLEVRATSAAPDSPPNGTVRIDGAPWTTFGCDADAATVHVDDRRVLRGAGKRRARRNAAVSGAAHSQGLRQAPARRAAAAPAAAPPVAAAATRLALQRCCAVRCRADVVRCVRLRHCTHANALPSFAHSAASRLHAAVVHHPSGKVYIIELNATQGTLVDSLRLEKHRPLQIKDGFRCVRACVRAWHACPCAPPRLACHAPAAAS
jgi:hypothetical protein